jgi:CheY-like chemotaxis protein
MAADYESMARNLLSFYDFNDKTVIAVGAGGGKLAEYGRAARQILAVDNDPAALKQLGENLDRLGLAHKFTLIQSDFSKLELRGDAVLFEFCLHEMADAEAALTRAKCLAPDVVLFDHAPGSPWAYYVVEEEKVRIAWEAVARLPVRERREYETVQKFRDYGELLDKVRPQGEIAVRRIDKWRGQVDIIIPMVYSLALI